MAGKPQKGKDRQFAGWRWGVSINALGALSLLEQAPGRTCRYRD